MAYFDGRRSALQNPKPTPVVRTGPEAGLGAHPGGHSLPTLHREGGGPWKGQPPSFLHQLSRVGYPTGRGPAFQGESAGTLPPPCTTDMGRPRGPGPPRMWRCTRVLLPVHACASMNFDQQKQERARKPTTEAISCSFFFSPSVCFHVGARRHPRPRFLHGRPIVHEGKNLLGLADPLLARPRSHGRVIEKAQLQVRNPPLAQKGELLRCGASSGTGRVSSPCTRPLR